jgi:hypothetical protein
MLNVAHVEYNETLDLACWVVTPQQKYSAPFEPNSIPVDTRIPCMGDVVHMISLENFSIDEVVAPSDDSGVGQILSMGSRVSIRVDVVTGIYPAGFRQYRWPCFTTSIPAEPGMSGGFVGSIGASGIICADNSVHEARSDQLQCSESVAACGWSSLCL